MEMVNKEVKIMEDKKVETMGTKKLRIVGPETDGDKESNPYLVLFKETVKFEEDTFDGVNLCGLEDMKAADMIAVQKIIERGGTINVLPEMTIEYSCLLSARITEYPVEFFKSLPPKEAMKIKNVVTSFLYGED